MTNKIIIQPDYHDRFACLAGDCPDTCCKGWVVEIDSPAKEIWERISRDENLMPLPGGHIPADYIREVPRGVDGTRFQLCMDETMHCPMLSKEGLCTIVLRCGEDCITDICRRFPRMETEEEQIVQKYLAIRCPAVLDLLWEKDSFQYEVSVPGEIPYPMKGLLDQTLAMGEKAAGPEEYLMELYRFFHFLHGGSGEDTAMSEHRWMDEISEDTRANPIFGPDFVDLLTRSEALGRPHAEPSFLSEEQRRKLKLMIMEEVFASVLTVDAEELDTVMVRLQWLIVQYLVIRYWLYLDHQRGDTPDADRLKYVVSRVFRITDHADIVKLSFFDPGFLHWMWTPESVRRILF